MVGYRVLLIPRERGPFAQIVTCETGALPQFQGGAVILTEPVDVDDTAQEPPAFQAWPLDLISSVVVRRLES